MARAHESHALRQVHTLYCVGTVAGLTDAQLLERFLNSAGEASERAFEALVHRHGPMVWGVCRSVLRRPDDTEDAFQATFLVLARKAASVRAKDALGHWLYGVARRVAVRAKMTALRRQTFERQAVEPDVACEIPDETHLDLVAALHAEIDRLPDVYRLPIVLCYLDAMTYEEAAHALRLSESTLRGRLARARERLRRRLTPEYVPALAGLSTVPSCATWAVVSPALTSATVRAACGSAGAVSPAAESLMKGVITAMFLSRLKTVGMALTIVGSLVIGAMAWGQQSSDPTGQPGAAAPIKRTTDLARRLDAEKVVIDEGLAKLFPGRVVGTRDVVKDCMVLAYLPEWAHGEVDNLAVANNEGGVRTLLSWSELDHQLASSEARLVVALYARQTTVGGPVGPLHAFALRGDWPERTSWNTSPDYDPEPAATFKFAPGEGWKLFDITDVVRAEAKAGRKANGVMLRFLSEDRSGPKKNWSGYQFVSREGTGEWSKRRPVLLIVEPGQR